jgi:hypothetical protein
VVRLAHKERQASVVIVVHLDTVEFLDTVVSVVHRQADTVVFPVHRQADFPVSVDILVRVEQVDTPV